MRRRKQISISRKAEARRKRTKRGKERRRRTKRAKKRIKRGRRKRGSSSTRKSMMDKMQKKQVKWRERTILVGGQWCSVF